MSFRWKSGRNVSGFEGQVPSRVPLHDLRFRFNRPELARVGFSLIETT